MKLTGLGVKMCLLAGSACFGMSATNGLNLWITWPWPIKLGKGSGKGERGKGSERFFRHFDCAVLLRYPEARCRRPAGYVMVGSSDPTIHFRQGYGGSGLSCILGFLFHTSLFIFLP
jgi:hypothetical protein